MTNDQLNKIKVDFGTGMDQEMLNLPPDKVDVFWDWFKNNAEFYNPSETNYQKYIDEKILKNRCFGNAQCLHITHGWDYIEGFSNIKETFILHGYNIDASKALDLTALAYSVDFLDHNQNLPSDYFGLKIPSEVVWANLKEITEYKFYNSSLLLSYFNQFNSK